MPYRTTILAMGQHCLEFKTCIFFYEKLISQSDCFPAALTRELLLTRRELDANGPHKNSSYSSLHRTLLFLTTVLSFKIHSFFFCLLAATMRLAPLVGLSLATTSAMAFVMAPPSRQLGLHQVARTTALLGATKDSSSSSSSSRARLKRVAKSSRRPLSNTRKMLRMP